VKAGVILPTGGPLDAAEIAREAEDAGWDGLFVFEPVWGWDAWVSLAAAATTTQGIRLGTMLSPISRMRPWKLAGEATSLDHLSGGRLILSVGLGAVDTGFEAFGEVTDRRTRAELLDEGLDIVTGLWLGQPFTYEGKHYHVTESSFLPPLPLCSCPASRYGWSAHGDASARCAARSGTTVCFPTFWARTECRERSRRRTCGRWRRMCKSAGPKRLHSTS